MALRKEKLLDNGVIGNYWKVIEIHLNRVTNDLSFIVALFLSEAKARDGAKHLPYTKSASVKITDEEAHGDLVALAYKAIMTIANTPQVIPGAPPNVPPLPGDMDLEGAKDVIEELAPVRKIQTMKSDQD